MKLRLGALVLSAAVGLSQPAFAGEDWQAQIRDLVNEGLDDHDVVGASVAIVRGDQTLFAEGFGWADEENEAPVTPDTLFRVGSITKTLTALSVMQLVEEGALALDDPFGDHLPGFEPAPPIRGGEGWSADQITVRSLLTHHSGIVGDVYQGMFADEVHPYTAYVDLIRGVPAASVPDRAWAYSNVAFTLLGHMVEVKRGKPYTEVIGERIIGPAGMTTATFDLPARGLSRGYAEGESAPLPELGMLPAGSLNASANDLANYSKMLLARGQGANARVIPEARLAEMWRRQNTDVSLDLDLDMGLAFFRRANPAYGLELGHSGGTAYFVTLFYVWPEQDLAVILLTNSREGGALIGELGRKLGRVALAGLEGDALEADPEPAEATDAISREDVGKLTGHYQTQLGHIHLVQRGKRLRGKVAGDTLELRATDRGTFVPYAILLGFIPLRPAALESLELGFENVDGQQLMFQRTADGLRAPAGIRIEPAPATPAWLGRVGDYEILNDVGDLVFDRFELALNDGILEVVPSGPMAPGGQLRLVAEPVSDTRLLIPGLGRNRGDVVDVVTMPDGEEIHFSGFRGRKID